ncbi:MAG: hypothetical protein M1831_005761 [Alyxoria varia]|nr:MAG: hypothetical protein M1831_005761 [Alyxoria varia]
MSPRTRASSLFSLLALSASILNTLTVASPIQLHVRQAQDFAFPGDPSYGVETAELSKVLKCPEGNPSSADDNPVLLVHGTGSTGEESWGSGYVPALKAKGFTPCYIDLPSRAMGDMQLSSSYVAYSLHALSHMTGGGKIPVIGHSQGNPNIQWALQFYPSTQDVTAMYVGLSPDLAGVGPEGLGTRFCDLGEGDVELCAASIWQQAAGSEYYEALERNGKNAKVPTTLIWSKGDEVVIPAEKNAQLPGATVIAVQDLCPLRFVGHLGMVTDAAGFALALDALSNDGQADLNRVRKEQNGFGVCGRFTAEGMDSTVPDTINGAIGAVVKGIILTTPKIEAEPPIREYAR